jgi:hypothetical protein
VITQIMFGEPDKSWRFNKEMTGTYHLVLRQLDHCSQQWQPTVAETQPERRYQKCPFLWWADPRALCQYQEAGDTQHSSDVFQMLSVQTLWCGEPDLNPSLQLKHQSVNRKFLVKIRFQIVTVTAAKAVSCSITKWWSSA